jgi:nucleoside-diphosphate-sugar epimerase
MKILLIGANGYVGSAVYKHFKSKNIDIVGVDNFLRNDVEYKNKELVNSDYSNLDNNYLDEFTDCLWLSGYSSVSQAEQNPKNAFKNNLINLVTFRQNFKGRFIYASSGSVYSREIPEYSVETSQTAQPLNMYDYTKIAFDNYLVASGEKGIGLRFGTVNGPGINMKKELMINSMVRSGLKNRVIEVSNSEYFRPILSLEDLINGLFKIVMSEIDNGIYNMCSLNSTIGEIAEQIAKKLSAKIEDKGSSKTYNFMMDNSKFQKNFEFQFSNELDDIVSDLVSFYEK